MPGDLAPELHPGRMTAFILAALWACVPGMTGGYFFPKAAMAGLGMLLYWLRDHPRSILFLAVMSASAAGSIVPSFSLMGVPGVWTLGLLQVTTLLLLMTMPTNGRWLRWAGVALSVHALLQVAGLDPLIPLSTLPSGARAIAWIGSPIDLGALLAMAAPVSGPYLPLVLAGIWATGSRGALLAVVFAFGSWRIRLLLLPLLLWPFLSTQGKDIARVEMVKIAWRGFAERPVLGQGLNTYDEIFAKYRTERLVKATRPGYRQHHAHNDILEMLCSTGILGLLAYLILLWPLRHNQSLVALFVLMKFNPVSFEVLAVAALVAANELRKRNAPSSLQTIGSDSLVSGAAPSLPYPPEQALARNLF